MSTADMKTDRIDAQQERTSAEMDKEAALGVHAERVDKELAKYADSGMVISPERSKELRGKIDKRVLSIMIFTYFLQAIDKGTLSFASIMGLTADTGLENEDGSVKQEVSPNYTFIGRC